MSPFDDFLEFTSPTEFEAAIPHEVKDRLEAMTKQELMDHFDHLWRRFLDGLGARPSLEERQEYFLIQKYHLKILS
jgi:hypothetical protein